MDARNMLLALQLLTWYLSRAVQEQRNLKRRELDNLRRELERHGLALFAAYLCLSVPVSTFTQTSVRLCSFYNQQKQFNVAAKASETVQLRATLAAAREREVEEQAAKRVEEVSGSAVRAAQFQELHFTESEQRAAHLLC